MNKTKVMISGDGSRRKGEKMRKKGKKGMRKTEGNFFLAFSFSTFPF